jgi:glucose/arabinose dehydrogenase
MFRFLRFAVTFSTVWNAPSIMPVQGALVPHELHANGKTITLSAPAEYSINVAVEGLRRVRFLAKSPDGRIFATDMYSRADNSRGQVLILDGWDATTGRFAHITPYLQRLRNPNSIAFYTDKSGQSWLYVALTNKLVRYRYAAGDMMPSGELQTLAQYPDYGLDYKYGGWHLTRTVAFGKVQGRDRMFVAVGSSCNACVEKEPVRATISVMDTDGGHSKVLMRNVRNAVGLRWDADTSMLLATNMGDDQLGDRSPDDTLLSISAAQIAAVEAGGSSLDAGWPYCYVQGTEVRPDPVFGKEPAADCGHVIRPLTAFAAHSSPLGVDKLSKTQAATEILVALHGAGHPRIGTGYRVVSVSSTDKRPRDFLTGFLAQVNGKPIPAGRPCGILTIGPGQLLVTDDLLGAIYYVHHK